MRGLRVLTIAIGRPTEATDWQLIVAASLARSADVACGQGLAARVSRALWMIVAIALALATGQGWSGALLSSLTITVQRCHDTSTGRHGVGFRVSLA